jgi:hypothetical protein
MNPLRTRRRRRPAPVAPMMQIDLEGDWRQFTRLLPKDCKVLGVVTLGDDSGALVKLASRGGEAGAYARVTGGEVCLLNQQRVSMKLADIERQAHKPKIEMVEVD